MLSRSFTVRMSLVILLVFAATAVAGTLLKPGLDWLVIASDAIADHLRYDEASETYDFGRAFRRLFMLTALLAVVSARRWLGPVSIMGLGPGERRWRYLAAGFAAGVVTWLVLDALLIAVGARSFGLDSADGVLVSISASLIAAFAVGAIEELALRGYLLGGLRRDWPAATAVLGTSALYAILHFLKAPVRVGFGFDAVVGIMALGEHFAALARPGVPGGLVGLLLAGTVLACAYLWTRSLPFAIGLHAGWVLLMQTEEHFIVGPTGQRAIYGPGGILTDWPGWAFLVAVLACLYAVTRNKSRPHF